MIPAKDEAGVFVGAEAAQPVRASRAAWTTRFVDVSNNNGPVDWRRVAHDAHTTGITAAEMKFSEGISFVDELAHDARAACYQRGLRVMGYHFARPDLHPGTDGAILEARHFCATIEHVEPYDWRPMLDLESGTASPAMVEWVQVWNREVWRRLGVAPVLYSYWAYLEAMRLARPLSAGLVFAYPNGLPGTAPVPHPWKRWTAHQYSWHGSVAGVRGRVDLNYAANVWDLLADPVRGAAAEPGFRRRRSRS